MLSEEVFNYFLCVFWFILSLVMLGVSIALVREIRKSDTLSTKFELLTIAGFHFSITVLIWSGIIRYLGS